MFRRHPYREFVFALGLALVTFVLFVIAVVRDPRSFGNAVLLGLTLALGSLGVAQRLSASAGLAGHLVLLALLLAVALGPFLLGGYLIVNGVTMARRESPRPGNLLSLVAGCAVFVVIGLDVAADRAGEVKLSLFATVANLVFGYVSFLLFSYVAYAFVYGRIARPSRADFVVVLGAGLRPDGSVPPLLASRLDRGRRVFETVRAHHAPLDGDDGPLLIVSGGKGDDERQPEAEAMARYLISRGFPADRVVREDQSRNTEENLRFSKAIMDRLRPGGSCVIVTSDYHAFRAAILARQLGVSGQVTGARVAGYYRPSALLREFAALLVRHRAVHAAICAVLIAGPVGYAALREVMAL
jgi:uncharacterized SAM-binding protein YcdF (DUF218 family)